MSQPSAVRILTTRTCRWTLRLSVALREKAIPFELVHVLENGVKAPWFVASTPFGKTPVFQHGARTLPESLIICEYIEETFGGRPLLPRDPMERAWARIWLRFCDDTLIKALSNIVRAAEGSHRTQAIAALLDEGRRLETYRAAGVTPSAVGAPTAPATSAGAAEQGRRVSPYWHGDRLTLPDICYHTFFEALERTGVEVRDCFLAACPHLAGWRDALLATGAFEMAARELDALGD
jgi:glutathione S-transferase